ncbi:MAG: DUF2723 domain-containing protein [Anaerolineae bacterium]|nr:DUF2723 domain-containing protein [Anaerolineae bacterium]
MKIRSVLKQRCNGLAAALVFLGVWGLYALTAAPGTVFGDPSEYQFIPAIWGIAHPPGYAFYTLLAGVWQRLFPVGSVALRTNLLAGAVGAWAVSRVFLLVVDIALPGDTQELTPAAPPAIARSLAAGAALLAALSLAVSADFWQHSIHANAHIVSVALTLTQLWLLSRWMRTGADRWLFALAFFCGIGVTHHPITVFGLPAYAVAILVTRPRLLLQPKTWLPFVFCGLLGLVPWLYFPLRSPDVPFGPTDMATWAGFLRHATAQGLRVNLFHFGWADQWDRLRVFWTLLRLQYPWPLLALMGIGSVWLARRHPRTALLWGLFLLGHLGFTLNSVQDVMAYLLHPFGALSMLIGVGVLAATELLAGLPERLALKPALITFFIPVLMLLPLGTLLYNYPRITLRNWNDADAFVQRLVARFQGGGEMATLASDWEHLTPYFYRTYVEGMNVNESDLRALYVTGSLPWTEAVFGSLPRGPVYLSNYRRDIRDLGFRLRPEGDLWRVLEPPATAPVAPQVPLTGVWADGRLELLGYDLPITEARQGEVLPLTLYARVAVTQTAILMPYARLGNVEQRWTTDSRHLTPDWLPGEIIVEQYEVFVPFTLVPGIYPLVLGYTDMTSGVPALVWSDGASHLDLGTITVTRAPSAAREARTLSRALTNVGNDVALLSARARVGLQSRQGLWETPLAVKAGSSLHLALTWRVLARPRTGYTVFIHLIDASGAPWLGHDYTPLGGAFPSYLWFPKWLEGQQVIDPYRLVVPETTPPGQYWLEVGMYEMGSIRRIPQFNFEGTMVGDRLILGPVVVTP